MELPAISSNTLVDQAFLLLEEAIIKGEYQPGAKLDEVALARTFGISRGPVREAIRRLEGKRLVERVPHLGARVAVLRQETLNELLEVREVLECLACRLATERMSKHDIAELEELLDRHASQGELKAGEGYFQQPGDYDFHFRIIQSSGNRKLVEMLCDDLYYLLRIYRYRSSARKGRAQASYHEHRRVVEAMKSGDGQKAEAMMREHLQRARWSIEHEITDEDAQADANAG